MSRTVEQIEKFWVWATLVVYTAVWVTCLSAGFRQELLPLAIPAAVGYAWRMHASRHILLCAEPAALVGGVAGLVVAALACVVIDGGLPDGVSLLPVRDSQSIRNVADRFGLVGLCGVAFLAGHVLALACAATIDSCLRQVFREMIAAELQADEPDPTPDGGLH